MSNTSVSEVSPFVPQSAPVLALVRQLIEDYELEVMLDNSVESYGPGTRRRNRIESYLVEQDVAPEARAQILGNVEHIRDLYRREFGRERWAGDGEGEYPGYWPDWVQQTFIDYRQTNADELYIIFTAEFGARVTVVTGGFFDPRANVWRSPEAHIEVADEDLDAEAAREIAASLVEAAIILARLEKELKALPDDRQAILAVDTREAI